MRISIRVTAGLVACASNVLAYGFAQAGPCTADIAQFETAVHRVAIQMRD
jgi:hypothetical protein